MSIAKTQVPLVSIVTFHGDTPWNTISVLTPLSVSLAVQIHPSYGTNTQQLQTTSKYHLVQ